VNEVCLVTNGSGDVRMAAKLLQHLEGFFSTERFPNVCLEMYIDKGFSILQICDLGCLQLARYILFKK